MTLPLHVDACSVVCTLIDNGKLANQIAVLMPIVIKKYASHRLNSSQSLKLFFVATIIIIIVIIIIIIVFAGVLFVYQSGANHAPRASATRVNHSVHTLSTFLRICADPSTQIF